MLHVCSIFSVYLQHIFSILICIFCIFCMLYTYYYAYSSHINVHIQPIYLHIRCIFCTYYLAHFAYSTYFACPFFYFDHCLVPQLRAQLLTYHHLHLSLPSFVLPQEAPGKSADFLRISYGIVPVKYGRYTKYANM
jgi:hypothetical protein